jgi:hypothetical protein
MRAAPLLALAMLTAVPVAVSQQMLCALAAKHQIDLNGNGLLTDSVDSDDPWKSHCGRYDATVYAEDGGDMLSYDGIVGIIGVGSANIYGKVPTGPEGRSRRRSFPALQVMECQAAQAQLRWFWWKAAEVGPPRPSHSQ